MIINNMNKILILGSCRRTGKDTLCRRLTEINPNFQRFAFADTLKDDMSRFLLERFSIDVWNCTPDDKEFLRPLMIAYGMAQRQRDPDHWVKRLYELIEARWVHHPNIIPVITDGRFLNEVDFFKSIYPGSVFVQLFRDGAPPPTDEEEKHWRQLAAQADITIHWGNNTEEEQLEHARKLIERLA